MIWKEMRYRPFHTFLGVLAVTAAVGLVVLFLTTAPAAQRETRRIQRDLGFNLRIISARTDPETYWQRGYSDQPMPEEYLDRLSRQSDVSINHLVGVLQQWFPIGSTKVLLTGITDSANTPGRAETRMRPLVREKTLELGYEAARLLKRKEGDRLDLGGRPFAVERVLLEKGTEEDLRVYGNLREVQEIVGLSGKINEIRAVDCLCLRPADRPLEQLRRELGAHLPEARILMDHDRAAARAQQRHMIESYMGFLIPVVVVVAAISVAALMMGNVRGRRQEIGLLAALGMKSRSILFLFLGKALAVGTAGAVLGSCLGTVLAVVWGPAIFELTAAGIRPLPWLILVSVLAAPLVTALACLPPAALAATLPPADALRED